MGKSGTPSPPRGGNNLTLRFQVDQARRTHSHNNPHFSRDTFPVTENRRWDRAARDVFSLDTGQAQKPTGTRTCRKALRIFKPTFPIWLKEYEDFRVVVPEEIDSTADDIIGTSIPHEDIEQPTTAQVEEWSEGAIALAIAS